MGQREAQPKNAGGLKIVLKKKPAARAIVFMYERGTESIATTPLKRGDPDEPADE